MSEATRTAAVSRERTLAIRKLELAVTAGPDAGARLVAAGPRVVIGTHASAQLALADPTVSRFHCELEIGDGHVTVRDLGSKNGTRVGGLRVVEALLEGTARLAIGQSEVEVRLAGTFGELPLAERDSFGELVGAAPAMRALYAQLERATAADATVLLIGETGTGKELAARAIHEQGARGGPYVVIDCGALPASLIDAELYGFERGAFTGAHAARPGAFEAASGGTVFLDEIGELPLELQPKLLRVLEQREVQRLGSDRPVPIDVRIVAASNRDLRAEVNAGRFRADLFYRLAVLEIRLPPLREHLDDIPLLVDTFLEALGAPDTAALRDPTLRGELARHGWPGNVRELRNYVERALAAPPQPPAVEGASGWEPPPPLATSQKLGAVREQWVRYIERRYITQLLEEHRGNVSAAARAAGLDRAHFYRIMAACGLR